MRYVSGLCGMGMRAIACVFLLGAAGVASAQEGSFYFGAGVGDATLDINDLNFKSDDTAFKLFGGIDITDYLGAEIAYVDGGMIKDDTFDSRGPFQAEIETTGIQASALGQVPITDQFSLFGRVGVFFWETDTTVRAFGFADGKRHDEGEDVFYGLGGAFKLGQGFELRLEYNLGKIKPVDFDADFSTLLVSGVYRFE